jgi:hypothetical protein
VIELTKLLTSKAAQLSELLKLNSEQQSELKRLRTLIENLEARIDSLLRVLYGKKSEKQKPTPEPSVTVVPHKAGSETKNKPVRKQLPEHLEREIIKYELSEADRVCYGQDDKRCS